jgi:hypothetical protein
MSSKKNRAQSVRWAGGGNKKTHPKGVDNKNLQVPAQVKSVMMNKYRLALANRTRRGDKKTHPKGVDNYNLHVPARPQKHGVSRVDKKCGMAWRTEKTQKVTVTFSPHDKLLLP